MLDPKLDTCHEVHRKEYGTFPTVTASAPGKVGLLGDYTEFAKGVGITAALSCRLFVTLSPRADAMVRFFSREYNERKKTAPTNLKFRKEDRWANYPKGVLASFAALGVKVEGLDLAITGEIPQGIGLASSQALCLASALAFNEFFRTGLSLTQLIQMAHKTETGFLGQCSDIGSFFLQAHAREDHLFFLDYRSYEWERIPFPSGVGELAVLNSRVPSSSFDSSAARAREECELCLRHLAIGRPGRALRDYGRTELRDRVGTLPESARRRSLHVIDEISRTIEARDAWLAGDALAVGRLMNRSHESLRDLYEVSCPEIDWLVKRLQESDAVVGARMSGEDSGGCVVAVARPEAWKKFRSQTEEYERIFGFKAEVLHFRPSTGALVHTLVQSPAHG
jgi:galactokinase